MTAQFQHRERCVNHATKLSPSGGAGRRLGSCGRKELLTVVENGLHCARYVRTFHFAA